MKTVVASSVLFGGEAFVSLGEVEVVPDRAIGPDNLRDADALIVRSKTRIDEALLAGSKVAFVGTATAGFDHLDTAFLERAGIAWTASPGCNANSVAEYVVCALLLLAERHAVELEGMTLGVIGVGQVGGRVVRKAEALGMRVLLNDPPLKAATGDTSYIDLETLLEQSDIVTLHVPLTDDGPCPTRQMADDRFFERMKPGAWFFNACRGETMDSDALLRAMDAGVADRVVLDVWEDEPDIRQDVLDRVDLGTPHIAGYSFEGRFNGTVMCLKAASGFFETPVDWTPDETRMPAGARIRFEEPRVSDRRLLYTVTRAVYDMEADDRALRNHGGALGLTFERLRKNYPDRREFAAAKAHVPMASGRALEILVDLGFGLSPF